MGEVWEGRPSAHITCIRCGVVRTKGSNSRVLCTSCKDTMSESEKELWAA